MGRRVIPPHPGKATRSTPTVQDPANLPVRSGSGLGVPARGLLWLIPFAALALFVAGRMGLETLWATVDTPAGPVTLPNGLAGVDHPFHAVRAETLRRSLAEGEVLRWVGHHQGGYPVEFYPLGAAWLAVAVWAAALGTWPIEIAYAVSVWLVFLLPGVVWVLAAQRDRLSIGTAFLALAVHVAVPGAWWHGGYTELVQWGLVTNVAASVWVLAALLGIASYARDGGPAAAAIAMAAAAGGFLTNPRSAVALVAVGIGVVGSRWLSGYRDGPDPTGSRERRILVPLGRIAVVALGSALLAAPELIALARFSGLYTFVRYERYGSVGEWWASTISAVSPPVAAAAAVGLVATWVGPDRPVTRAASLTLPLYGGLTLLAAANPDSGLLVQLEATRLMPFQRLLTIWLAAYGVVVAVSWLWRLPSRRAARTSDVRRGLSPIGAGGPSPRYGVTAGSTVANVSALLLGAAVVAWWVRPGLDGTPLPGPAEAPDRGLYPVARSGVREQVGFERAVRAADAVAAPGTALLAVGSGLSWHQQLWAPLWTARPLLYDDWLWYWHLDHAGPPGYDALGGHHYPDPELALDSSYLRHHAVGAAVVTGRAAEAVASAPGLEPVGESGAFVGAEVQEPSTIVASGGRNATGIAYANGRIAATLVADGDITVRHNWHPRWRATLDGSPTAIDRAEDGTMRVNLGRSGSRLELVYGVDGPDRLARLMSAVGIVGIAVWGGIWVVRRRRP